MPSVICSVSTRGRYHTTLLLTLQAIAMQTRLPDKLVIFDDNDDPIDVREIPHYKYIFQILDLNGVKWDWVFAGKKGQHHNHQAANTMEFDWVWRVDDDAIPEPNVLSTLMDYISEDVGAIAGDILTPPLSYVGNATGKIDNIDNEQNLQWDYLTEIIEVEHLHCSFLYRAGVHDYHLGLSRVAHREETLFTYGLHLKGYKLLLVPNATTWHLKNPEGGIRSETNQALYEQDEFIFRNFLKFKNSTIVVLDGGMGDHIVFSHVLPDIHNPLVFTCYPEIVEGKPLSEAYRLFGNIDQWNIYKKMHEWKWTKSLELAYRKLYL